MSSAVEVKLEGQFKSTKEGVAERITLDEMGHKQEKTTVISDNTTAVGIANRTLKHKRSKAMDMTFQWTRNREAQGQFKFIWRQGSKNIVNYPAKHHPEKTSQGNEANHSKLS